MAMITKYGARTEGIGSTAVAFALQLIKYFLPGGRAPRLHVPPTVNSKYSFFMAD